MAENKKPFLLYADLIHTVRKMPKGKVADLFLTILSYVNDENPEVNDIIVQIAFEPIKQQLKRDLKKYETIKSFRAEIGREGGIKSGETRRKNSEATKQNEANEANEANSQFDTFASFNHPKKTKQTKQTKQKLQSTNKPLQSTNLKLKSTGKNEANEANEADNDNDNVINKAAGEINFEKIREFLRTATNREFITDEQIEQEAKELKKKYNGMIIQNLKSVCNSWADKIKPWQKEDKSISSFV